MSLGRSAFWKEGAVFISFRSFPSKPISFFLRGMKLYSLLKTWCSSCTAYEEPSPTVNSCCVPGVVALLSFVFHNMLVLDSAVSTKVLDLRT